MQLCTRINSIYYKFEFSYHFPIFFKGEQFKRFLVDTKGCQCKGISSTLLSLEQGLTLTELFFSSSAL